MKQGCTNSGPRVDWATELGAMVVQYLWILLCGTLFILGSMELVCDSKIVGKLV